jgi:hypothetical protein
MPTRQTNRRGVASAMCAESRMWSRRSSYWSLRSPLPVFYFWREHLSCFHR